MKSIDDSRFNSVVKAFTPAKVCAAAISLSLLTIVIVVATLRPDRMIVRFNATRYSRNSREQVQLIKLVWVTKYV